MKYNVHVYAVVRIKVADIEATTPESAAKAAEMVVQDQMHSIVRSMDWRKPIQEIEDAEAIAEFLVDPLDAEGNVLYADSVTIKEI